MSGFGTRSRLPRRRACGWAAYPRLATTRKTGSWSSTRMRLVPSFTFSGDMSDSGQCARSEELDGRDPEQAAVGGRCTLRRSELSRGALYLMLQNRIYRGEITHKGNAYPASISRLSRRIWDEVQAILAENRVERAIRAARNNQASLPD